MIKEGRIYKILIYPFKGLDPQEVDETEITEKGSLKHDREFVLFDEEGNVISGKREKKIHRIRSFIDFENEVMRFTYDGREETFFFGETEKIEEFFSEIFGYRVFLKRFKEGYPDDRKAHGPTIVSRETLKEVAKWYNLDEENVRRRFRTNIEVEGVPAFWEDFLVGKRLKVGSITLYGKGISKRCPVPTRDPYTGEDYKGFVKVFIENRKKTLPEWSSEELFKDTFYRLCLNTIPEGNGGIIKKGDKIEVI